MKHPSITLTLVLTLGFVLPVFAQDPPPGAEEAAPQEATFDQAAADLRKDLDDTIAELNALRELVTKERVPLNKELNELEAQLSAVRKEYAASTVDLDSGAQDLLNLRDEIKRRTDTKAYLDSLFVDYLNEFSSRLHIAETKRYAEQIEEAKLAPENDGLSAQKVFEIQSALVGTSLDRLEDSLGGLRFDGQAVDKDGVLRDGTFVIVGPAALFRSHDGKQVGTAEQQVNSLETSILPFANPEATKAASQLVTNGVGSFPFDPTLGTAHKFEETEETLVDEFKKGGEVMYAILGMAGLALIIALFKWLTMAFVSRPSKRRVADMLDAVDRRDTNGAQNIAAKMPGPVGKMLSVGADHLGEPRDLIEEVMFERVLTTRLKLQRLLPFIAICAASAPLLGLLGTVSGIINTFKTITVVGSGDVKSLSGGISEALITTKYGLIVAIPSLLLHAFLSRKARSVVGEMETAAVSFANRVSKAYPESSPEVPTLAVQPPAGAPDKQEMKGALREMLGEVFGGDTAQARTSGRDEERTMEAHA